MPTEAESSIAAKPAGIIVPRPISVMPKPSRAVTPKRRLKARQVSPSQPKVATCFSAVAPSSGASGWRVIRIGNWHHSMP